MIAVVGLVLVVAALAAPRDTSRPVVRALSLAAVLVWALAVALVVAGAWTA